MLKNFKSIWICRWRMWKLCRIAYLNLASQIRKLMKKIILQIWKSWLWILTLLTELLFHPVVFVIRISNLFFIILKVCSHHRKFIINFFEGLVTQWKLFYRSKISRNADKKVTNFRGTFFALIPLSYTKKRQLDTHKSEHPQDQKIIHRSTNFFKLVIILVNQWNILAFLSNKSIHCLPY